MEEKDNKQAETMTFFEHLEEMRWVILKCLITLVVACGSLCFFFPYLNAFLMGPLNKAKEMLGGEIVIRISSVTSPIFIIMYMVLLGGFAISLPIMAYFVATFIAPALNKAEKAVLIPAILSAICLFFIGAIMTYYLILPLGIYFSSNISIELLQTEMLLDAEDYYSFVCLCILGIGLAFELPLLQVILIYLGVLKVEMLKRQRRWVFLILFIIAAVITPPDFVTQITLAFPLYALFELALIVGNKLRTSKEKREKAQEEIEAKEDAEFDKLEEFRRKNEALKEAQEAENDSEDEGNLDDFEVKEKQAQKNDEANFSKYAKYYGHDDSYGLDETDEYIEQNKQIDILMPKWELNIRDLSPKWNLNDKKDKDESTS